MPRYNLDDLDDLMSENASDEEDDEMEKAIPEERRTGDSYGIAAAELRQFIERYERLQAEKDEIAEQQKEVMAEAKGRGYDTKVMKKVISLRKRNRDDVAEEDAILEMYMAALGMV